jgi:hypothetical protein
MPGSLIFLDPGKTAIYDIGILSSVCNVTDFICNLRSNFQ